MHNKSILGGVLDLELKNNVFDEISEVAYYRIKSEKSKRIFLLGRKINRRKQMPCGLGFLHVSLFVKKHYFFDLVDKQPFLFLWHNFPFFIMYSKLSI